MREARVVSGVNDFTVALPSDERTTLRKLIATGTAPARTLLMPASCSRLTVAGKARH